MSTDLRPILVTFKVNSAGSWANLVTVESWRVEEVKAACEQLAKASIGQIAFKATATGVVFAQYSSRPHAGEPHGWYDPRNR